MNTKTILLITAATPLLLGCDILNKSSGGNGLAQSSAQAPAMYEPVYNDQTNTNMSAISDTGYAAVVGNPDGTLSQVFIRMNEDRTIAYVSIDGGPEEEYDTRSGYSTHSNGFYGTWSNGDGQSVYVNPYSDSASYTQLNDGSGYSRGYGGIETMPENLPSGEAVYSGSFSTSGDLNLYGHFAMTADFAESDLTGVFNNGYYSGGDTFGTIDGEISGGRVAGTFFADGRYEGELDFQGAFYGDNGNQVNGGIAGTLTDSEENEYSTGGQFYGYQQTGFEEEIDIIAD